MGIAALSERTRKMHFAQTRNCRESENEGQLCKRPAQVQGCQRARPQAGFSQMKWAPASDTLATPRPPQGRQGPLTDPGGTAVLPEALIFPGSHYFTVCQTWADMVLAWGLSPRPATRAQPLPTRSGWAALLLLFSPRLGPSPAWWGYCSSSLQGEELRTSRTESGQGLEQ